MGLINNDSFSFASGATAAGTYLKVSGPAFMLQDPASATGFVAKTTLEIYYNREARDKGMAPMQIEDLLLPVDPSGVYAVIFNGLKQKFHNTSDVLDEDPGSTTTNDVTADPDSTTKATADSETPATTDATTTAEAAPPAATDATASSETPATTDATTTADAAPPAATDATTDSETPATTDATTTADAAPPAATDATTADSETPAAS